MESSEKESDGSGGQKNKKVTVAAAVAVTVAIPHQSATIASGLTVRGSTGAFVLRATGNTDSSAKADGSTAKTDKTSTSVGAAVAVNIALPITEAIAGTNATI